MLEIYFFLGLLLVFLLFSIGWSKKSIAFLIPAALLALLIGGVLVGTGIDRQTLITKHITGGVISYSLDFVNIPASSDPILFFVGWFLLIAGMIGIVWLTVVSLTQGGRSNG